MLNWIVWNWTDYLYKMDLALNNLQGWYAIKPKRPTNINIDQVNYNFVGSILVLSVIYNNEMLESFSS